MKAITIALGLVLGACAGSRPATPLDPPQHPDGPAQVPTFRPRAALITQKNVDARTAGHVTITHSYLLMFERPATCDELDSRHELPGVAREPSLDLLLQAVWPQPPMTMLSTESPDYLRDHVDWAVLRRPATASVHLEGTVTVERSNPDGGVVALDLRRDGEVVRGKVAVVNCP